MNKFAALLMFFLGASFMLQAIQAQGCEVAYYDIPAPPECETYIDENGEEEEECTAIGSAAFAALLDSTSPTLTEPTLPLNDLDFTGDCDCTLRVYSGLNLGGCYVQEDVVSNTHINVVGGIWTRTANPQSFEVTCTF